MKKSIVFAQFLFATLLISCGDTFPDDVQSISAPTAQEFASARTIAFENIKQGFTINTADLYATVVTEKGTTITINTGCLTKNGVPVTGEIDIELAELYDRGKMLINSKPTMGLNSSGEKSLLISGGELFISLKQNGVELETTCGYELSVPAALTGGVDPEMTSFAGTVESTGEVLWEAQPGEFWTGTGETQTEYFYNAIVENFGWFNCDKFAAFTGPMTNIAVTVPVGYNTTNSNIFVALAGEPNTLGTIGGEYPVGLEVYLIFVTVDGDGNFIYAIKPVTLPENAAYTFTESEFITATESQLVAAINALP